MLRHANAGVCLPHGDRFPPRFPRTLLPARATLSTIATPPFPSATALPLLDSAANWHSNPIAHRVRRKRQRLPPSLLIENASDRLFCPSSTVLPEAFPIKASDHSSRTWSPRLSLPHRGLAFCLVTSGATKRHARRQPISRFADADNFMLLEPRIARNMAYTTCIRTSPPSLASRRSSA